MTPGAHAARTPGRYLMWLVVLLGVLAVIGFLLVGANGPADPHLAGIPGFGEVAFRVTPGEGRPASGAFCALLAETEAQRAKGLMGRRDLAGYDAMIFRFNQDSTNGFHMRNVPVSLSIAWFDAEGRFVSTTDMAPCPDQDGCPVYSATGPYRVAVEAVQGGLDGLGVGPGSVISVGGACTR